MSNRNRVFFAATLALVVTAATTPALAEDADPFNKHVNEGLAAYQAGRYDEAIESFRAAKAMKSDPKLLYNIGRCYEKLGRLDDAIAAYQEFVNAPGTTSQERAKGFEQIKALQAEKGAREDAARPPPKPAEQPGEPHAEAPPPPPATGSTVVAQSPPPEKKSHALEWGLVGVGGAGVVVGAIFGGLALNQKSQFDSATSTQDKLSARDAGNRDAIVSDVCVIGGAALAVAGLAILFLAGDDEAEKAAGLAPSPDGRGWSATFGGRF
jgi:hypothetical protein